MSFYDLYLLLMNWVQCGPIWSNRRLESVGHTQMVKFLHRVVNINRQLTLSCSDIILYHHKIQTNKRWYISPLITIEYAVILYYITTKYKKKNMQWYSTIPPPNTKYYAVILYYITSKHKVANIIGAVWSPPSFLTAWICTGFLPPMYVSVLSCILLM